MYRGLQDSALLRNTLCVKKIKQSWQLLLIEQKSIIVFNDCMKKINDPRALNGLMSVVSYASHNADKGACKVVSLFI